ncbi:11252_t:CDS:2, partial [Cetraspora pellucida]
QHTAIKIQQAIIEVLDHTKITEKLLGITTDNAQNMITAGQELKQNLNNNELVHQRCAAHILNIAVQHGLQLVSPFLQMQDILDIFIVKNRDLSFLYLQDDDWTVVNNMIQLLEPIFIATEILSTSVYSTISDVRLTITGLLRHLDLFIQQHTNLDECMVAESINFKLQEYWEHINESTTIVTLLDPQSKTRIFKDISQHDKAVALLRGSKQSFFESLILEQNSEQLSSENEIARYLALPVNSTTNLLDWWHHFSKDFPILASMAS